MKTLEAIIFDLDGTLADTAPIWRHGENLLFEACGHPWSIEVMRHCIGMNAYDVATTVHAILQPELPVALCKTIMRDGLIEAYQTGRIAPIPGAPELVRRLYGQVPLLVASGSPMPGIQRCVQDLGIADCFDHLITSEDVPRGKPHPDVFLLAAKRLGVAPEACVVFEDSLVGTQAAVAAQMRVMVRPQLNHDEIAVIATRVVTDWDDITWPL